MADKESVRALLRNAFPDDPRVPRLTHDECVQMRPRLIGLRNELLPAYLCQVMEDLFDHPGTHARDSDYAEFVVRILNVDCERPIEIFNQNKVATVADRPESVALRLARQDSFALITANQAEAICEWLQIARTWPTLEWDLDSVDAAYRYWKNRAGKLS